MCQIQIMFPALESRVQCKWIRDPSKAITALIPTIKNRCQKIQASEVRFPILLLDLAIKQVLNKYMFLMREMVFGFGLASSPPRRKHGFPTTKFVLLKRNKYMLL